ncbi:ComEA family DNA-binding protein [Nocardia transvalensis]|uniref:ComEA family DNA-binding protein n=1 Tax=Nocardia transvalensis TaxID=37333 RepID=UPI0018951CD8|nr:helix-hairpin-helix domain-containing protein [Nocardia transvalensis]MBF6331619.1 helix-hairpin-helix domain-containing protein [Nocardia transvalensis]
MARDEQRVRERLGALEGGPRGGRAARGGRWDAEEFEFEDDGRERPGDGEWGEGPRTPQWLSEPVGSVSVWHERLVPERFRGTRLDPGRRGVVVLAAIGLAAVVVAAAAAQQDKPTPHPVPPLPAARADAAGTVSPSVTESAPVGSPTPGPKPGDGAATSLGPQGARPPELIVSVVGLVEHPGLLHLPPGSRVADAVSLAVTKEDADLASLNLAQRLADGDQIVIGAASPHSGPPRLGSIVLPGAQRPAAGTAHPTDPATPPPKIDLNTATESDLDSLPGVGPATARAIITWRTDHGRFTTIDQLAEIPGIGPTRLNRIRNLVTV